MPPEFGRACAITLLLCNPLSATWDADTVVFATKGAAIVEELSIWTL